MNTPYTTTENEQKNEPMFRKTSFLKHFFVLLLIMGATKVWGAFSEGLYYIKSNKDATFYLCPSIGCYYDNNVDQSHLTTFKTDGDQYSIWKIVPAGETDTYYLIHYKTGRYLKSNEDFTTVENSTTKHNRKAVHLEVKPETLTDEFKFLIKNSSSPYQIYPKIYYTPASGMSFNPTNEHKEWYAPEDGGNGARGMIGLYDKNNDFSKWQIPAVASASTPCATPIIKYDGDNINISYPYSDETGITIYYTTDGAEPTTSSSNNSSTSFNIPANGVIKVRAFAAKSGWVNSDEAVLWGNARSFLIQNMDCTDYYLVPAFNGSNVNTSSLPGMSMQWTLQNAGASTGGVQYYYVVNSNSKKINYNSSDNTLTLNDASADANKFCVIENGYNTGNFFLIPVSQTNRVLYKNSGNVEPNNCKAELNKKWGNNLDQWSLRVCNVGDDQKDLFSGSPFSISNDDETHYYHISSVGTAGYYMVPPAVADGYATTSNTSSDYTNNPWIFKVAASDNWLTYYYIINAASGKYMYFNPNNNQTANQENVISMKSVSEKNAENEEKFQFIMVRSTTPNACYIVPKGYSYADSFHKYFESNKYFGLWLNETGPLKTTWSRSSTANNVKWEFVEAPITDLYLVPVFSQDGSGNITITHPTVACDIHYTTDGTAPSASSTVYDNTNGLSSTEQHLIKAIAKLKTDASIVSEISILFNKPDVTLLDGTTPVVDGTYTYDRTAHEPTVGSVYIGGTTAADGTYAFDSYENNTDAGTATVNFVDNDDSDNIFFGNFSTDFTINPALLTIGAEAQTKEYNEPDPELTYTKSGIIDGEDWADVLTGELSREAGEGVGSYSIVQGTLAVASTNYTINYTAATLTITPKILGDGTNPAANITYNLTKVGNVYNIEVKQGGSTTLTVSSDYTKSSETDGSKYYEATITGVNNYDGSFKAKYAKVNFSRRDGGTDWAGTFVTNPTGDADYAVPANMHAYVITGITGNVVIAEELDYIPETVPVLLMSSVDAEGFMVQNRAGGADITSEQKDDNLLKEVKDASKHFDTAAIYLLYKGEFVLNMEGDLAKGKIYLDKPGGPSPAPVKLYIDWDLMDGIDLGNEELRMKNEEFATTKNWYTLDGRRLDNSKVQNSKMPKGVYIVNGKKVIINN